MDDTTSVEGARAPIRLLVIDDDEVDRRVLRRHLRHAGLEAHVDEANGAGWAYDLAATGSYDCIVLDYRFPEGTAFEVYGELLAKPLTDRPPIVLTTGMGDERIAAESIERGAQYYLRKADLGPESLRLAIEAAQEKAALEREVARRDEELVRLSFYDALTDLPNRRLYFDRLEQAIKDSPRGSGVFAVLMMDLNLFKQVNDRYGHEVGDELLRQVAARLRGVMRESDTVARLGGDEFAAVLSTARDVEGAIVVADKICSAIDEPFMVDGNPLYVGVSVGMALFPDHGGTAEELLRHADVALYESKRTSRGVRVYGGAADRRRTEASMIAQGLKGAIARQELFAVFQPQVRLDDGAVVGVEALVRWRHPELGLLPATKFIPAAERSDIIEALTYRVLELSLEQSRSWREHGLDLSVSVNLSARLLDRDELSGRVGALLEKTEVPPHRLFMEVTETGIMHAPDEAARALSALSELGVKLSIDDFGTGYSSLKYLRDFPIDEIKIDGLFIRALSEDSRDAAIVESVLGLGSAFGVRVVAEGIESDAAWRRLHEMGCPFGQGYRVGRPMGAIEFGRWYERWGAARVAREVVGESGKDVA